MTPLIIREVAMALKCVSRTLRVAIHKYIHIQYSGQDDGHCVRGSNTSLFYIRCRRELRKLPALPIEGTQLPSSGQGTPRPSLISTTRTRPFQPAGFSLYTWMDARGGMCNSTSLWSLLWLPSFCPCIMPLC